MERTQRIMELAYVALKVFVMGFLVDWTWVRWMRYVNEGSQIKAGFFSMAIAAPALLGYHEVMQDLTMGVFYLLGLFCGTVVATKPNKDRCKDCQQQKKLSSCSECCLRICFTCMKQMHKPCNSPHGFTF